MKMGLLGGTFDPPHNGHLQIAQAARRALRLARVFFVPAKQPPHKLDDPISPLSDRVAMLERALAEHPEFAISLIEAEREGPSYTVDTLRKLRRERGARAGIYFIMGEDSLINLPTWHEPQEIVKLARLAVLMRPGYDVDLDALERQVPGVKASAILIPAAETDISASEIRARVRRGESIRGLVPPAVARYIKTHHLYRRGADAA
jgi:nicotinate-nucleotide adenylyltransferase